MNAMFFRRAGALVRSPRGVRLTLDLVLAAVLFGGTHAVYRASTGTVQLCDSTYSLVVSERLLTAGTLDLGRCIPADAAARAALPGYRPDSDLPYHLVRKPDPHDPTVSHVYYGYPLGSSVLALPFVHYYLSERGLSIIGPDGVPGYAAEGTVQTRIAARVCAAMVAVFYLIARFYCSPVVAALIAAGFAFGSPVWSTLSRSLWSHTGMAFWLAVAVALLVAAKRATGRTTKADLAFGIGLGTALFWAGFCRQHAALSAFAIGVYLLLHDRRLLAFTVVSGGIWAAALVGVSLAYFGTPMPPSVYAAGMIDGRDVLTRFTWLMVSPARGLLVYCPYLIVAGALLLGYRRHLIDAGLLLPALLAIGGHTALLSCYNGWHANWAYGPRYYCDVLPWFVLLTAMGAGTLAFGTGWRKWGAASALTLAFGWGVFVHARGANSQPAWHWNDRARAVGDEAAVKDWHHPQFLAGITFVVNPDGTVTER